MAQQAIDNERIEEFEGELRGNVIRPDDAEYDDARAVWNGDPMTTNQQFERPSAQQTTHVSRRNILKTGMITAGALALSGTADAMSIAPPTIAADAGGGGFPSESNGAAALISQLNTVYAATRKYQHVAVAKKDGYSFDITVPNVGHIFLIADRVGDGEVDITTPEALIYVATSTTTCEGVPPDADLDLAAIEYLVPGDQSANPPDLFADDTAQHLTVTEKEGWHYNEQFDVTGFHAWVHFYNLAGVFNLSNPAVSEEGVLKGLADQSSH
jgi:hypothetical protein